MDRNKARGIALIVVIMAISVIVPTVIYFNRITRAEYYDSANTADNVYLYYLARSGFNLGQALLLYQKKGYDTLTDSWAKADEELGKKEKLIASGELRVQIEDESGKIPLNKIISAGRINETVVNMLKRLLSQPEFGLTPMGVEDIVAAIIDWIDNNEDVSPGGAESLYYAKLPVPYEAKNAPLDDLSELLMVKGITPELFYGRNGRPGLSNYLSIRGSGWININTAPVQVLQSLSDDMTRDLANEMDLYRKNEANDLSSINWYKNVKGMSQINLNRDLIDIKSDVYKIKATATLNTMKYWVEGVVKRDRKGKKITILSWKGGK